MSHQKSKEHCCFYLMVMCSLEHCDLSCQAPSHLTHSHAQNLSKDVVYSAIAIINTDCHAALSNTECVCRVSHSQRDCANLDFSVLLSDSGDGRLANRDRGKNSLSASLFFLLSFTNSEVFHFCFAQRHFFSRWQSRRETLESFLDFFLSGWTLFCLFA